MAEENVTTSSCTVSCELAPDIHHFGFGEPTCTEFNIVAKSSYVIHVECIAGSKLRFFMNERLSVCVCSVCVCVCECVCVCGLIVGFRYSLQKTFTCLIARRDASRPFMWHTNQHFYL